MQGKKIGKILISSALAALLLFGCQSSGKQYIEQADKYMEQGEYGLAFENYNKAIMEDEELQKAYRGAGIASMKLADYETAQDLFLRGLKETDGIISELEMDLSYYLGETQACLGKYQEAVKCYTNILEYDDEETEAYFYRGASYLCLGKTKEAEKDFQKAAKNADSDLLYGIYEAYAQNGSDAGRTYLDQIVKNGGDSKEELYTLGKAYLQLGDEDKAVEALEKSRKKGEQQAAFYLGCLYEQKGDYDQAVQYYTSYQSQFGLTYGEYHTVAECMMKQGDFAAALELNQYMQKSAGKSELQDLLYEEIVIYEKGGEFENARNKAESYVKAYPDDEKGLKEYEFLMTR